jgi:sugar phosphate isomerase/epimerase
MEDHTPIFSRRDFLATLAAAGALIPFSGVAGATPNSNQAPVAERKICVFSKHLHWLEIPEMAKTAADLGFDGVDLTVRKGGHISPEKAAEELPRAVEVIRKAGLDVPMIATDIVNPRDPLTEPILKAASRAGIRLYRTGYLDYDPQLGVAKSLEKHRKQLVELAALNKKHNIHGAYQNHAGTRIGAPVWDLWVLLKDIDPRRLGVQYDPKHATVEGGNSWILGLNLVQAHVKCMDIKDFVWAEKDGKWQTAYVPLGQGMVDFKTYFKLVKQYQIPEVMSMHFEYPLGGANTGNRELTVPKEQVLAAMQRDLQTLRVMLKEAEL